jgi:hypothetical protein
MKGLLAAVTVIGGVVANLLALGGIIVTLSFGGEAYRGRESAPTALLWNLSWVLGAASVLFSLWFAWCYFTRARIAATIPFWTPVAAAAAAGIVGLLLINLGERADGVVKERARRQEIAALRAAVAGGQAEKICALVAKDPQAKPEQMAACRAYIESLSDARRRWEELQRFVFKDSFAGWNPQELGQTKEWDWNRSIPVVPASQQPWFVQTYFDTWLSFPETLTTGDDLTKLHFLGLSLLTRKTDWSPEVRPLFRDKILPRLKERIERRISQNAGDAEFADDGREVVTMLADMAKPESAR